MQYFGNYSEKFLTNPFANILLMRMFTSVALVSVSYRILQHVATVFLTAVPDAPLCSRKGYRYNETHFHKSTQDQLN